MRSTTDRQASAAPASTPASAAATRARGDEGGLDVEREGVSRGGMRGDFLGETRAMARGGQEAIDGDAKVDEMVALVRQGGGDDVAERF